jgi:predicted RNA-binding Zn ribbon-like protein
MVKDSVSVPPLRLGDSRKPAPGELALLQGFINTYDLEELDEDFPDAAALGRWLAHYGLMGPDEPVSEADFKQSIRVREALRAVLMEKNGGPPAGDAADTLNAAAKSAELIVRFDDDGNAQLVPVRGGADGALARLLAIAERSQCDGRWERFKGCPDDACGWIFYDWSKNRSATWCSMEVCGNRAKARTYRERRRAEHDHEH